MEMKCVVFVIIMRRYNIFFYCTLAKFIWRVIQLTFGLGPPNNIKNVFGAWVHNTNSANRQLLFVGIGVMFWAIWLNRNDVVFNKTLISSYMQVIFRVLTGHGHGRYSKRKKNEKYSKPHAG
jgi:hypothetical protein